MKKQTTLLFALLFAVLAWGLYAATARYGFVHYDDVRILLDHPELYGQDSFGASAQAILVTCFPREEPLLVRDISWALDSMVFGFGNPLGYHLGNIFLHGLVVALLFLFLASNTPRRAIALWTTALFLVLGVHVEPVAWIMGRKDLLSSLFMLLALCAQTRRLTTASRAAATAWYGLTFVCLAAGLLSKISVLTFPAVLLLHAWLFPYLRGEYEPKQSLPWRRLLAIELPLAMPMFGVSLAVFIWYRGILAQVGLFDRGYAVTGLRHLWNLAMVNPMVWWLYLKQICAPANLSVLYTWPALQPVYGLPCILASLATLAGTFAVTIWMLVRRKDLLFYWISFCALMIPYMNLIYIGIWAADRYIYFSSFCLLAIAVNLGCEAASRGRRPRVLIMVAAAVILVVNVSQNIIYQRAWRDGESLWQKHITLPNPSPVAYDNLAAAYYAMGRSQPDVSERILLLRKMEVVVTAGLQQFWPDRKTSPPPETWHLFFMKAIGEQRRGMPEEAIESYLTSERLNNVFRATRLNLAMLYRDLALDSTDKDARHSYAQKAIQSLEMHLGREATPEMIVSKLGADCLAAAEVE